jgi:phosphatidyl-myo-inositol dimannoside synthase
MKKKDRWFLGATILGAGQGGIACVARITARTLLDEGADLSMLSLLDEAGVSIAGHTATTVRGNRLAYVAHCHKAALSHKYFLYDSVGAARAHPRIPGLRRPYGIWMHGVEVWDRFGPERARVLRGADFVLVNSQFTLDKFQDLHGSLDNAHVCWLATEDDEPPVNPPKFDGPPTALLIGRSDKDNFRKGHKEVVESWAKVVEAVPDAELLIAGGGDGLELLRETVNRSSARDSIKVLGFVPEEEIPDLWSKAQVFVQPSWKEGFGLVYIEAMRHGLPVIASVHDAGQEVNIDGVTGYNVDLERPQDLADRLIHLLQNPGDARAIGQAGFARWREHFRFGAFKARLMRQLEVEVLR